MKRPITWLAAASALLAAAGCASGGEPQQQQQKTEPAQTAPQQEKTTAAAQPASEKDRQRLPRGSERVDLDPADFTNRVDNPYWPMRRGSKWDYRGEDERIVVTVTSRRKTVEGIPVRVLRDVVSANGELIEDTYDWYAQDSAGNVWYMGEDTKEYVNGRVVSREGSWESGVDGAEAGIIMPADPRRGLAYRQEYYAGEAEDRARVLSVRARASVPFRSFRNVLMTEDTTPLEPRNVERKFYAKGVGPILRVGRGGGGREELVSFRR